MIDALPSGAGQIGEPGAGGGEQVRRLVPGGLGGGRLAAGSAGRLFDTGHQRVVDGAEERGAGGGECDEVVFARGSARRLLGRLRDPRGQRRPCDGVGESGQTGALGGLGTEQARDKCPVEAVDGRQCLVESGDVLREQVGTHHATALVGGNHCISGSGAVVGVSSR